MGSEANKKVCKLRGERIDLEELLLHFLLNIIGWN